MMPNTPTDLSSPDAIVAWLKQAGSAEGMAPLIKSGQIRPIVALDFGVKQLLPDVVALALASEPQPSLNEPWIPSEEPLLMSLCTSEDHPDLSLEEDQRRRALIGRSLLAAGASFKHSGYDNVLPITFAAINNRWGLVEELIKAGADPHFQDRDNDTLITNLIQDDSIDGPAVLQRLIDLGLDLSVLDKDGRSHLVENLLSSVCKWTDEQRLTMLEQRWKAGLGDSDRALLKARIHDFVVLNSPLSLAYVLDTYQFSADQPHQFSIFLGDFRNVHWSILHSTAYEGQSSTMGILLQRGADVNAIGDGGITPLDVAAAQGHASQVELLLTHGARVNTMGYLGTPLHAAMVNHDQPQVVQALLDAGADASAVFNGMTPMDLAQQKERFLSLMVLEKPLLNQAAPQAASNKHRARL